MVSPLDVGDEIARERVPGALGHLATGGPIGASLDRRQPGENFGGNRHLAKRCVAFLPQMKRALAVSLIDVCRVAKNYRKSARSRGCCHLLSEFPRARFRILPQYPEPGEVESGSWTS